MSLKIYAAVLCFHVDYFERYFPCEFLLIVLIGSSPAFCTMQVETWLSRGISKTYSFYSRALSLENNLSPKRHFHSSALAVW